MDRISVNPEAAFTRPANATNSLGILVLGMHRSGTSAITRVLNLLGCALPDALIGPSAGNELGHWEAVSAVTLNDEILASAGSRWDDWGPINEDWRASGLRAQMLERVVDIVEEHVALGPLFALKDPRLCRVADLWLDALDAAEVDVRIILLLRHPGEVAASLENRDLMAPGYAQLLWLRHALDSEYFSRGRRRVVCRYDQLLGDWLDTMGRIKRDLGISLPRNSPVAHAAVDRFLTSQQRHHDALADPSLGKLGASSWLKRGFEILRGWSESGENEADHAELDSIREEFDRAYPTFARLLLSSDLTGNFSTGSDLKRELDEQLADARQRAEEAQGLLGEVEKLRGRETELLDKAAALQALLEMTESKLQQSQYELESLRPIAARAEELAAERERLLEREADSSQQVGALQASLDAVRDEAQAERSSREDAEERLTSSISEFRQQELRNAELAGRIAAAESALVQRQEELAQLWDRLASTEKAAGAAQSEAAQERERRLKAEEQLAATLMSLQEQASRIAEESERAVAAEARLALEQEEQARLSEQLFASQKAAEAAATACAEAEHKLAPRIDEIARLTAMLAEESARAEATAANTEWLRRMAQVAQSAPKWWAFKPQSWRRRHEHRLYLRAGLFDADRYLEAYPDVAASGMDPVRHYILHGMSEGRTIAR